MGKEALLWADMKDEVSRLGHFERIENGVGSGVPDVSYSFRSRRGQRTGWLELKVIEHLPTHTTKEECVFVSHFRKAQRVWHTRYALYGGESFVLLYIRREKRYWLFTGKEACRWMGRSLAKSDYAKMEKKMDHAGEFPTELLLSIL